MSFGSCEFLPFFTFPRSLDSFFSLLVVSLPKRMNAHFFARTPVGFAFWGEFAQFSPKSNKIFLLTLAAPHFSSFVVAVNVKVPALTQRHFTYVQFIISEMKVYVLNKWKLKRNFRIMNTKKKF